MKNPLLIILALFASFIGSYANETPARTCRIVFIDRPANAPKALYLYDGNNSQKVELPSMNLSPLYNVAPGAINLKFLINNVEDPKEISPDAPSVEIPEDYTDFLLLVFSDTENKVTPVKIKAITLTSENFKIGQMRWSNLTDKTIEGKLGVQTLSLGPQISKVVDAPSNVNSVSASGYFNASFTFQVNDEGDFAPITEQQWWHDATSRHLGFIVDSGGKLPKIYFYRDFRNPNE
jgi:hypothetical protein